MTNILRKCMALLLALFVCTTGRAATLTDLWYNPEESGWGLNVVQQDEVAFITLFVYGADGAPTWYFAPDARLVSIGGASGLPRFSGALYRSRGPWHGGPFDASRVEVTPAGRIAVEALTSDRMRVQYDADGVSVQRDTVRQTWRLPPIGLFYLASFSLRQLHADGSLFGVVESRAEVIFFVQDGAGFLRAEDDLGRRCDYHGPYTQAGHLGSMAGAFTCDGAEALSGTFELTDIEVTAHGVTAFLHTSSATLQQSGRFGGIRH